MTPGRVTGAAPAPMSGSRPSQGPHGPHIVRIGTAHPPHDVHAAFRAYARTLLPDTRARTLFDRMADRAGIPQRWSFLQPGRLDQGEVDAGGFYRPGAFPGTAARMRAFEPQALALARSAVHALDRNGDLGAQLARVTHLVVATCTGFTAPGLDLQLTEALGLRADVARTMVGFMGCAAAVPALRVADAVLRAQPEARVLVVNVELSSLHLRETADLEDILSFLLFGDGASAALLSCEPQGLALLDFQAQVIPNSQDFITWHIGDHGFEMHLSGKVPGRIAAALRAERERAGPEGLLRGVAPGEYELWAVHAGGRSVLDAVQYGLDLAPDALDESRAVLDAHGNMSSATVMFVLQRFLARGRAGQQGLALAFGPGMVAESLRFEVAP